MNKTIPSIFPLSFKIKQTGDGFCSISAHKKPLKIGLMKINSGFLTLVANYFHEK